MAGAASSSSSASVAAVASAAISSSVAAAASAGAVDAAATAGGVGAFGATTGGTASTACATDASTGFSTRVGFAAGGGSTGAAAIAWGSTVSRTSGPVSGLVSGFASGAALAVGWGGGAASDRSRSAVAKSDSSLASVPSSSEASAVGADPVWAVRPMSTVGHAGASRPPPSPSYPCPFPAVSAAMPPKWLAASTVRKGASRTSCPRWGAQLRHFASISFQQFGHVYCRHDMQKLNVLWKASSCSVDAWRSSSLRASANASSSDVSSLRT